MKNYQIIIDLSADIKIEYAKDNDIALIPMQYSLGEEFKTAKYLESDEVLKEFYDSQRKGDFTKTTQITPFIYEEFFRPYLEKEIDIIYLPLSSGLSKTYESALIAKNNLKEEFPNSKIFIVDSLSATGGIGLLATLAVNNRNNGMIIEDNAKCLEELTHKMNLWLMVEDLNYLKRGGRVSATSAFVGSLLGIKPILRVNEKGKLDTVAKMHGRKKAAMYLVNKFIETRDESVKDVFVCHADNIEYANYIKDKLLEFDKTLNITICMLSPIIGAHTGPGMCCVCYIGK